MSHSQLHPDPQTLRDFGLGWLAPDAAAEIERHVLGCESCCDTLADLGDDTFVSLVRTSENQTPVRPDPRRVEPSAGAAASQTARAATIASDTDDAHEWSGDSADACEPAPTVLAGDAGSSVRLELPPELGTHPRYRVRELLGRGGMGQVYKAEHRLMERTVALKVINPQMISRPGAVERFQREVKAAARLAHPNIVAAYDAEQAGDAHFLIMEYVEGIDLAGKVRRDGPLPVDEACECVRQAALGLQHAHEHGMVHRDIKPQNLMWAARGPSPVGEWTVKILDFGLAGIISDLPLDEGDGGKPRSNHAGDSSLTTAGQTMGTPDYIAPEQAVDAHAADIRADIYSLGCTLYFLLTGRPPFAEALTPSDKLQAHAEQAPQSVTSLRHDVPPGLAAVLDRLLAKRPADRYQHPADVAAALEPFARGSASPAPARPRAGRRWPRRAAVALACSAAAVLLGSLLYAEFDTGRLVLRSQVGDVQVVVKQNGEEVIRMKLGKGSEVVQRLRQGRYQVQLLDANGRSAPDHAVLKENSTDPGGFQMMLFPLRRGEERSFLVVPEQVIPAGDTFARLVAAFEDDPTNPSPVLAVDISPGGEWMATSHRDGRVFLWDLAEPGKARLAFDERDEHPAWDVAFSPDGQYVAWVEDNGRLRRRLASYRQSSAVDQFQAIDGPLRSLTWSPDGRQIVTAGKGGLWFWNASVPLFDVPAPAVPAARVEAHAGAMVNAVVFSPDGRWLATAAADGKIALWDVAEAAATPRAEWDGHRGEVHALAWSPDGAMLVSGGADGRTRVWHAADGRARWSLEKSGRDVLDVAISPDGSLAAAAGRDHNLLFISLENRRLEELLGAREGGHAVDVSSVAFSRDGRLLASADMDGRIRLWELTRPLPPMQRREQR